MQQTPVRETSSKGEIKLKFDAQTGKRAKVSSSRGPWKTVMSGALARVKICDSMVQSISKTAAERDASSFIFHSVKIFTEQKFGGAELPREVVKGTHQ